MIINNSLLITGNVQLGNSISLQGNILADTVSRFDVRVNYENNDELYNRPRINNIELIANKTSDDLGLQESILDITSQDIDNILFGG